MATVHIRRLDEFTEEEKKRFEASQEWFKIDFLPQMSSVLTELPEFSSHHGRAMKRAMPDGELTRGEKEIIASAVSGVTACHY